MSFLDIDKVQWEPGVDRRFKNVWKKVLEEGCDFACITERASTIQEETNARKPVSASVLRSYESSSYNNDAEAKDQSILGWAVQQENARVVMSIRENVDNTIVGWAIKKQRDPNQPLSSVLTRSSQQSNTNNKDEEEIDIFVTQCKDLLKIHVHEVGMVADRVTESPALQYCVNQVSVRRYVVGVLFADLYANCFLVGDFIKQTDTFLKSDDGRAGAGTNLLFAVVGYFCIRELAQFQSERLEYLSDPWNTLDVTRLALTATSAYFLRYGQEDETTMEKLLMTTSVFIFTGVISFLRSAFLPFSKFVYGIRKICIELLPFFVITGVTLLGFGYMYWVRNFKCPEKCDIVDGFYAAYALLVGGPEEVANGLDIFAGFVLVIILLNVVIAIVTKAWETTDEEDGIFWQHRMSFLIELRYFLNQIQSCQRKIRGKDGRNKERFSSVDSIGVELDRRTEDIRDELESSISFMKRLRLLCSYTFYKFIYFCLLTLGLVTFGILWPRRVREYMFGMNRTTKERRCDQDEVIDSLKEEMEKLQESTEPMRAQLQELNEIKRALNELQQLIMTIPGVKKGTQQQDVEIVVEPDGREVQFER